MTLLLGPTIVHGMYTDLYYRFTEKYKIIIKKQEKAEKIHHELLVASVY